MDDMEGTVTARSCDRNELAVGETGAGGAGDGGARRD
jgi:hypothetical protein